MRLPQPPLLVITDRRQARAPLERVVAQVLAGGCRWLSLREKDLAPAERLALLKRLLVLGEAFQAIIGVHGDTEAAGQAGARHLHLPAGADPAQARRRLGKDLLIGVSAHTLAEAQIAQRQGADYCTLSPILLSRSKPGYTAVLGAAGLARIARQVAIPLLALGGVEAVTVSACLVAGAAGVAVMGPLMRAADPRQETRRYIEALDFPGVVSRASR